MTETETDLTFTLTPADALAWERLPRELRGWRRLLFFLWLAAAGAWLTVLPERWIAGKLSQLLALLPFVALHWGLASLAMSLAARRRARRRIPAPVQVRLVEQGQMLSWQLGESAPQEITPATIRQVLLTRSHLFLDAPPALVILPVAAFETAQAAQDFATRWDALSAAAAP